MVIWGGEDINIGCFSTGGRYDPLLDTWTPTGGGAPQARTNHTAVWTKTEMIVWGGVGGCTASFVYLNTGGRYNPQTNVWTSMSTLNAPAARQYHTAVWTGRSMAVWGGSNEDLTGLSGMDTGARYNAQTNVWTTTSTVNAPSPRQKHTAVWTGSFMIVWGGNQGQTTGGRYALGHALDDDGDGFTECGGDCNDDRATVFPGAFEACDGLDNDCNGLIDETDADGDSHPRCAGDCDDTDPGAHAVPGEVADVRFAADKRMLSWLPATDAGSASVHDVVRGALGELPVGGRASEACRASGIAEGTMIDGTLPAAGEGFWYLVRGRNGCGTGTYGWRSDGVERNTSACP